MKLQELPRATRIRAGPRHELAVGLRGAALRKVATVPGLEPGSAGLKVQRRLPSITAEDWRPRGELNSGVLAENQTSYR